ncbi:sensor domain-containing diguanylate cyclase [Sporosarcina sp. E16_8]|uniref:sensor domain-containing diguanylate cyclase n=1 Tax=Sporosarcina sp. E16_8 TaxID=2789295 RepID=UPI001A9354F5|nr:sensor domain-containing diguanylate cyclase [Sporosarcina sp. E16_8]MBO0588461.1 GGDEF domain-containing protein [Sporosarcina sp. E16_8]
MIKTLRFWITLLVSFAMIGILSITLLSGYYVTKENLINNSLEINRVYSMKLARLTEEVFNGMQSNLQVKASEISAEIDDVEKLSSTLANLLTSSKNFNSLSVISKEGVVLATSPELGIVGKKLDTAGPKEALLKRKSLISMPYKAATGRLLILVSTPLWNEKNQYLGFLSGTIYLQEDNIINTILDEHFATDGSHVWVVDNKGMLIFHPDPKRIGEMIKENKVAQKILGHESGAQKVTNLEGKEYLAGYTYIKSSRWGVVSQTPYETSVKPLKGMIYKMLLYALPFVLFFFLLTIILTERLSSPLRKLAMFSAKLKDNEEQNQYANIPTWYFEAKQLNETIHEYAKSQQQRVENYKERSYTDPLTGLKNRRYGDKVTTRWTTDKKQFSVIMIDIDHFKVVNDNYGHHIGDEVLKFLAKKMSHILRGDDVCIRLGGEEFILLLAETDVQEAMVIAERLRTTVSSSLCPTNDYITISLGVGGYLENLETIEELYYRVDKALYQAKTEGRNRVVLSEV